MIKSEICDITYIKTGIGAPVFMDALLALGVTKCKNIIFVGSVGSLDEDIGIGDIVIPQYSICGDGASRYIASDTLKIKVVEYKGGKCEVCGYDKNYAVLEFHHLDPSQKDFGISQNGNTRS